MTTASSPSLCADERSPWGHCAAVAPEPPQPWVSFSAAAKESVAAAALPVAFVAHTMIPEGIHEGGSVVVLPTVAGFLFAQYLALPATLG